MTTTPTAADTALVESLDELRRTVATLVERVTTLEARLAEEVRTKRLVVVDRDGIERLSTTETDDAFALEVRTRADEGDGGGRVVLVAADLDDEITYSSMYVSAAGNIVAEVDGTTRAADATTARGYVQVYAFDIEASTATPACRARVDPEGTSWKAGW